METDEKYMQRALELAQLGLGKVSPNPLVGCVIVHENQIAGEGWHQQYGGPHAEVNAIEAVRDKTLLKESDVYVTLEPCAHYGKTPPCANLLVEHKVKRVIICNADTNPLVAGKGVKILTDAGIEVVENVLAAKGKLINKRFFTYFNKKRPYIILKWAETGDGFIARENFDSKWISNDFSRKLVHKWRAEEDAVLVGSNTGHYDNPRLNVRDWEGRNPVRVAADRNLRLSPALHLFDQSQPTLIYNLLKDEEKENLIFIKIGRKTFFEELFNDLYERKIQSVIVEGGSVLLNKLIAANLWDEARVFKTEKLFGSGIKAPQLNGVLAEQMNALSDTLFYYKNQTNG